MLEFVNRLDAHKIQYNLAHFRADTLMVLVTIPGQRWEVEFFEDGSVEVEKFMSDGDLSDERSLAELFAFEEDSKLSELNTHQPSKIVAFTD